MNASKQRQARMSYLVQHIRRQMVICGMISSTTNLRLDWGSKTYGNAFDLWVGSPGNPHEYKPFPTVYFGMTYRDAEARMTALLAGMSIVARLAFAGSDDLGRSISNDDAGPAEATEEAEALTMPDTPDHREITPVDNPYRHDHNPLNADFHGGICWACEWERDHLLSHPDGDPT